MNMKLHKGNIITVLQLPIMIFLGPFIILLFSLEPSGAFIALFRNVLDFFLWQSHPIPRNYCTWVTNITKVSTIIYECNLAQMTLTSCLMMRLHACLSHSFTIETKWREWYPCVCVSEEGGKAEAGRADDIMCTWLTCTNNNSCDEAGRGGAQR